MYKVDCNITIGSLDLPFVVNGSIKSSWQTLTDTAQIVLPRKITIKDQDKKLPLNEVIKVGDKVSIKMGYDGVLNEEFTGYVSSFKTGQPIVIECEDEMWKLKQSKKINSSWRSATLKDVIEVLAPGIETNIHDPSMKLGSIRINDVNTAQAFEFLRSTYGLKIYFVKSVLHVGFAYSFDSKKVVFDFNKNISEEGNNLNYRSSTDVKFKVTGVSILPNNEKIEVEFGDPEGALRTLHYYNLNKKDLEKVVEEDYKLLHYDGFDGSFVAFHEPIVEHGDQASIKSDIHQEQNGSYFIDDIEIMFGYEKGIKRLITIGKRSGS